MKKAIILISLFLLITSPALADITVIVHVDNDLDDIPLRDLKRIFLGKLTVFPDGENVVLTGLDTLSEAFCRDALSMSTKQFRRYWIKTMFAGCRVAPPQLFAEMDDVLEFMEEYPGAIAFIESEFESEQAKRVSIDGLHSGEVDYPLGIWKP